MTDKQRIAKLKARLKAIRIELRKAERLLIPYRPMRVRKDDADFPTRYI